MHYGNVAQISTFQSSIVCPLNLHNFNIKIFLYETTYNFVDISCQLIRFAIHTCI